MSWIDQSIGTAFYGALGSYQDPFNSVGIGNQLMQANALHQYNIDNHLKSLAHLKGLQDVNASTETVYPVKNGNSMNKKLEAAKKYLADRNKN